MHGVAGQVGLLLHAAGVGQHRARVLQQRGELEVAERRAERQPRRAGRPALEPRARPRVHAGRRPAAGAPRAARRAARSRAGSSTLPARWAVTSTNSPGAHAVGRRAPRCAPRRAGRAAARCRPSRRRPPRSARPTRSARRFSAAASDEHSSSADAWSVSTRLSSSGIARSNERMPASTWATGICGLGGGQRARQRRVGVAVDEHQVGALARQQALERLEHARRLGRVGAAAELQVVLGPRQAELGEEDLRELLVVVLAGVDQHLLRLLAQPVGDRRRLDELRPVPDDG